MRLKQFASLYLCLMAIGFAHSLQAYPPSFPDATTTTTTTTNQNPTYGQPSGTQNTNLLNPAMQQELIQEGYIPNPAAVNPTPGNPGMQDDSDAIFKSYGK